MRQISKLLTKMYRAKGKQRPIPEEIYQTLLTNKNQGNLD
jgi:hypothetical protein